MSTRILPRTIQEIALFGIGAVLVILVVVWLEAAKKVGVFALGRARRRSHWRHAGSSKMR